MKTFRELKLHGPLLRGLSYHHFDLPTKIQAAAIPMALSGMDLLVQSKSGTGKTLIFVISALQLYKRYLHSPQVLIIVPTRELAVQIEDTVNGLLRFMKGVVCVCCIGGTDVTKDRERLAKGDVVVGTPGRLLHLLENDVFNTSNIHLLVLDEADQLYTKSLQPTVNSIVGMLPCQRQVIACSATYENNLDVDLAKLMRNPMLISNSERATVLLGIRQFIYETPEQLNSMQEMRAKLAAMHNILFQVDYRQAIVFASSKLRADSYCNYLRHSGLEVELMSGALKQSERLEAFQGYRLFKVRHMIATDLMARGVDSAHANLVINLDLPKDHVTYLHRIGRAGRFGSKGIAVTIVSTPQQRETFKHLIAEAGTGMSVMHFPLQKCLTRDFWDYSAYNFPFFVKAAVHEQDDAPVRRNQMDRTQAADQQQLKCADKYAPIQQEVKESGNDNAAEATTTHTELLKQQHKVENICPATVEAEAQQAQLSDKGEIEASFPFHRKVLSLQQSEQTQHNDEVQEQIKAETTMPQDNKKEATIELQETSTILQLHEVATEVELIVAKNEIQQNPTTLELNEDAAEISSKIELSQLGQTKDTKSTVITNEAKQNSNILQISEEVVNNENIVLTKVNDQDKVNNNENKSGTEMPDESRALENKDLCCISAKPIEIIEKTKLMLLEHKCESEPEQVSKVSEQTQQPEVPEFVEQVKPTNVTHQNTQLQQLDPVLKESTPQLLQAGNEGLAMSTCNLDTNTYCLAVPTERSTTTLLPLGVSNTVDDASSIISDSMENGYGSDASYTSFYSDSDELLIWKSYKAHNTLQLRRQRNDKKRVYLYNWRKKYSPAVHPMRQEMQSSEALLLEDRLIGKARTKLTKFDDDPFCIHWIIMLNGGYTVPLLKKFVNLEQIRKRIIAYAKKRLWSGQETAHLMKQLYKMALHLFYMDHNKPHNKAAITGSVSFLSLDETLQSENAHCNTPAECYQPVHNKLTVHVNHQLNIPPAAVVPNNDDVVDEHSVNSNVSDSGSSYMPPPHPIHSDNDLESESSAEPYSSSGFVESNESASSGIDTSQYSTDSTARLDFLVSDSQEDDEEDVGDLSNLSLAGTSSQASSSNAANDSSSTDGSSNSAQSSINTYDVIEQAVPDPLALQEEQWAQIYHTQLQCIAEYVAACNKRQ